MNLTENEIIFLITHSKEVLMSQPILLELEAPIRVCGKFNKIIVVLYITSILLKGMFTDSISI